MNNSVANLAAAANKSASDGLMSSIGSSATGTNSEFKKTINFCHNNHHHMDGSVLDGKLSHQIGTNLTDLSVCWHKIENDKFLG